VAALTSDRLRLPLSSAPGTVDTDR